LAGTLTLLFADIEGSTRRWESGHVAMAGDLARHDALLRMAVVNRGVHVFKTVGDAFFACFATASDAVTAAREAQRALLAAPWATDQGPLRVRMALHTGAVESRDDDYFGPPLNRVARLLSAAPPVAIRSSARSSTSRQSIPQVSRSRPSTGRT
jgi:class 3 adenylate cyclase